MSGANYRPDRRIEPTPKVNRVQASDVTVKDEVRVQKKFEQAMDRAADALREERARHARVGRADFAQTLALKRRG